MWSQGGSVLPVSQYEGWGNDLCEWNTFCMTFSLNIVCLWISLLAFCGQQHAIFHPINETEGLLFEAYVLFLLTGRYETVLRLHGPSLWTQMDRVKPVIMKRSFASTVLLFTKNIPVCSSNSSFFILTEQFVVKQQCCWCLSTLKLSLYDDSQFVRCHLVNIMY